MEFLEKQWQLLQGLPGVQATSEATILAETGPDMRQSWGRGASQLVGRSVSRQQSQRGQEQVAAVGLDGVRTGGG